ncbi:MAG: hypothetical protein LBE08_13055 [Bifidobacteriaceae bacterium]|nr:hypothetical protein [Bifidobacteriaceae bacterium]
MPTDGKPASYGATPRPTQDEVLRWLGSARFERYLSSAHGDERAALSLYAWNSAVAAAALTEVWHLEVALRNAYDRELSRLHPDWIRPGSDLWARRVGDARRRTAQQLANERTLDSLADAGSDLEPNADNVIARTSFGMWCNLIDPHREPILWAKALAQAYPPGTVRGPVYRLSLNALGFRNRLSHNEPVFGRTTALAERIRQVRVLHALVSPASADWAARRFDLAATVARCPVTGLVEWPMPLGRPPSTLVATAR